MINLNSLSRENLMDRISKAHNGLLEIQRLKDQKSEKEKTLAFDKEWAQPPSKKLKVGIVHTLLMFLLWHFVWMYILPSGLLAIIVLLNYFYPDILSPYIGTDIETYLKSLGIDAYIKFLLITVLLTVLFTVKSVREKRKKLLKEYEESKEFHETFRKAIPNLQQEIAALSSSIETAQKKNAPYINVFPADYQSIAKLNGIYNILYNQRADKWADASSLYLQEEMQRKKLQEEMRHNQQMEQSQQELIRKQEEQQRKQQEMLAHQAQERMAQDRQIADEISGRLADIESDLYRMR